MFALINVASSYIVIVVCIVSPALNVTAFVNVISVSLSDTVSIFVFAGTPVPLTFIPITSLLVVPTTLTVVFAVTPVATVNSSSIGANIVSSTTKLFVVESTFLICCIISSGDSLLIFT